MARDSEKYVAAIERMLPGSDEADRKLDAWMHDILGDWPNGGELCEMGEADPQPGFYDEIDLDCPLVEEDASPENEDETDESAIDNRIRKEFL